MADTHLIEQEKQVKKLKRELEGWREIVLPVHSVLLWEKQWYPGMIAAINTSVFLILWLWDPSILTAVSTIALLVICVDYSLPTITSALNRPNTWTGIKEKSFEEICRSLAIYRMQVNTTVQHYRDLKHMRPKCYYIGTILALLFCSWIGNTINNLFLTYIVVSIILFTPGIIHNGLLDKYGSCLMVKMSDIVNKASSKLDNPKSQ